MGATKLGSIGRAIVARAVRFAIDGLEGPAHEEARESLERRLEDAEGRRRSLENDVLTLRELRARIAELEAIDAKARTALAAEHDESLLDAAQSVLAERDALAAELAAIRAATGEEPTDEVLNRAHDAAQNAALKAIVAPLGARLLEARLAGHRALYNLGRTAALGEVALMREAARGRDATIETLRTQQEEQAEEVATLRDRVDGLEIDLNSAVQNSKANEVEANNLRSANRTLRARVAELEAAPQGQPVATDEELWQVFTAAETEATANGMRWSDADRAGAIAVARHVRAERPTCLVERAVALGCDVRVCEDVAGWLVAIHESSDLDEDVHRDVAASDVPATLSRLLDEVEAARKAVQR